jgi:hypothetical protein
MEQCLTAWGQIGWMVVPDRQLELGTAIAFRIIMFAFHIDMKLLSSTLGKNLMAFQCSKDVNSTRISLDDERHMFSLLLLLLFLNFTKIQYTLKPSMSPDLIFQRYFSESLIHLSDRLKVVTYVGQQKHRRCADIHPVKNGVFLDVTPCGSCKNRRFGGT